MSIQERIERGDALYQMFSRLPGDDFADYPACDNPEATLDERAEQAELFFPVSEQDTARIAVAKSFCRRCPVREACLEYALRTGEDHGIWGGLTEDERREVTVLRRRGQRPGAGPGEVAA